MGHSPTIFKNLQILFLLVSGEPGITRIPSSSSSFCPVKWAITPGKVSALCTEDVSALLRVSGSTGHILFLRLLYAELFESHEVDIRNRCLSMYSLPKFKYLSGFDFHRVFPPSNPLMGTKSAVVNPLWLALSCFPIPINFSDIDHKIGNPPRNVAIKTSHIALLRTLGKRSHWQFS